MEPEPVIGRRLREIRAWRGLSLTAAAGLAGMSISHLSRIERGLRAVDRRSTLEALAGALRVAPSDLTGQPYPPSTPAEAEGHSAVHALRGVLRDIEVGMVDVELDDAAGVEALRAGIERAESLNVLCDYGAMSDLVPGLVARAHILAEAGSAEGRALLVRALLPAFYVAKDLGHHDVGWAVARHLHAATLAVGDPAWIGLADFLRAEAMGGADGRSRALSLVKRSADDLAPDGGDVGQAYGLLRLSAALQSAATDALADVPAYLDEAADVAAHTGDGNFAGQHFGPRNVGVWQVALAVEVGDVERVPELARAVDVEAIPSEGRRASFYADLGRGLAVRRGQEVQAVEALGRAETLAPQLFHANPYVRDTVTDLLRRARRDAGGRELRGLAYRMGVPG